MTIGEQKQGADLRNQEGDDKGQAECDEPGRGFAGDIGDIVRECRL